MEDWLFYSLTTLLCLLCSLLLRAWACSPAQGALPLPPGPTPVPVVGPLLFLARRDFDLRPMLRRLARAYGPIFSFAPLGPAQPTIFVTARGPANRTLVQRGAAFAYRPRATAFASPVLTSDGRNVSSSPYGPNWRAVRRAAASVLNPACLRTFAPARRWVLDVLISRLREGGGSSPVVTVNEPKQYAMFCLLVYMCFGDCLDDAHVKEIEAVQHDLLDNFLTFQVFAILPPLTKLVFRRRWNKLVSLRRWQGELFDPLICARREAGAGGDCYVDSLVRLAVPEDGGRGLTDGEIVSICSEFLGAGTDTTATALEWILANLVKNLAMQDRLREEVSAAVGSEADGDGEVQEEDLQWMPYLKAVVLEGLRRHPPVQYLLPHAVAVPYPSGHVGELRGGGHRAGRGGLDRAAGVPSGAIHARRRGGGRRPHRQQGDQDDAVRRRSEDLSRHGAGAGAPRVLHGQPGQGVRVARGGRRGGGPHREAQVHRCHEAAAQGEDRAAEGQTVDRRHRLRLIEESVVTFNVRKLY